VLSGRGLCDELITRPEGSYRLWRVVVCDHETSRMRRLKPARDCEKYNQKGCNAKKTNKQCQIVAFDSKYFEQGMTILLPESRDLANLRTDGRRDIQKPRIDMAAHANEL
jgi:hypothetical protein